jgi:hypothetical protein
MQQAMDSPYAEVSAEQRVHYVGQVVEGVVERGPVRHRAVAECGIVRSDYVVRV